MQASTVQCCVAIIVQGVLTVTNASLDRSFHAANVSIGIMHLYHLLGDTAKSRMYKEDLEVTISELNERTHFLGERGILILNEMNNFLKNFDFDSITLTLQGK